MLAVNTSGGVVFKELVPAGFATPSGIAVGPPLKANGTAKGWSIYVAETNVNSFAVLTQ